MWELVILCETKWPVPSWLDSSSDWNSAASVSQRLLTMANVGQSSFVLSPPFLIDTIRIKEVRF